ncbi:8933_t:CDS:2, partial [Cetraspora pellucida]
MLDYMFDDNDNAYDTHSLDFEVSPRGGELHIDNKSSRDEELLHIYNESSRDKELPHIDNESSRDEEPSQNKELLKKGKTNKQKRSNQKKNITVKYAHDLSMGNMLGHLWSKHRINKEHPDRTNTGGPIIKAMHVITKRHKEKLTRDLISCERSAKKKINQAYDWSCDQLFSMVNIDNGFINLMTDLWSSRANEGYIGITATWIDSNFAVNSIDRVVWLACSAYTLQLSILKGLKPVVQLIKKAKNLIFFFSQSPKQIERLKDAQEKCRYPTIYQVTDDVSTSEWQLLDELIYLLKPFYEATTIFSGSTYPTLNLIYSTMRLLIKNQLITDNENSDESDADYDKMPKQYNDLWFKGCRSIEPPVVTEELSDLVKAVCYLSLQEYWDVPKETGLIASFLDLRIKNLKFIDNENIKLITISTVRRLCIEEEHHRPLVEEIPKIYGFAKSSSISISNPTMVNDLISDLYNDKESNSTYKKTE